VKLEIQLRFKLHFIRYTTTPRVGYNSAIKFQCASLLKLGLHYQRVSIPFSSASGIIPLTLRTSHSSFSASVINKKGA